MMDVSISVNAALPLVLRPCASAERWESCSSTKYHITNDYLDHLLINQIPHEHDDIPAILHAGLTALVDHRRCSFRVLGSNTGRPTVGRDMDNQIEKSGDWAGAYTDSLQSPKRLQGFENATQPYGADGHYRDSMIR